MGGGGGPDKKDDKLRQQYTRAESYRQEDENLETGKSVGINISLVDPDVFLGLPDPDLSQFCTDPDPSRKTSRKKVRKTLIFTIFFPYF